MAAKMTATASALPPLGRIVAALALVLAVLLLPWAARAEEPVAPPLLERLTPAVLAEVFPGATRVEMVADAGPAAAAAFVGDAAAGYVFSTLDVLRAPGYSSTPFDVVAGVTLEGRITGAVVLFHREPYLINDALPHQRCRAHGPPCHLPAGAEGG